jgi:hypothetical protein
MQLVRYRTQQQRKRGARSAKSWVEFELEEPPWTVTLGFVNHGDELALADIRIFPTRDVATERSLNPNKRKREWGEWSGDPDLVPLGGLTLRTIRKLSIGEALKFALANVPRPGDLDDAKFVTASRLARVVSQKPPELDLRRRPPELLAQVAVSYQRALAKRRPPNTAIYEELGNSPMWPFERNSVPGLVRAARAAGYLTPAIKGRGRASGRATAAAHAVLRAAGK